MGENQLKIAIVTVSDRASRGEYEDRSGPAVVETLTEELCTPWQAVKRTVADERALLEATLIELVDREDCALVLTSGGTGPAPRDITPEATEAVCEKLLPGFGEAMRAVSFPKVPTAILSRGTAGIRHQSLIVNLPGSPKGAKECLLAVLPAIPDCLYLLRKVKVELRGTTHLPHCHSS